MVLRKVGHSSGQSPPCFQMGPRSVPAGPFLWDAGETAPAAQIRSRRQRLQKGASYQGKEGREGKRA